MKDFIQYEQAMELKELGFDEPCLGIHYNEGLNPSFIVASQYGEHGAAANGGILAPLYQQAFRWFREKHDLHSCVAPVYEDEISKVIVYWFWIQGFDSFEDEDINYKTPEEAELACLIKLIETVKTKQQ